MNLNNYILVKCFASLEYQQDFNNGELYMNNTAYYWNLENEFQQDREGEVLRIDNNENCDYEFGIGNQVIDFVKLNYRLDGYLMCFYLLSKSSVSLDRKNQSITIADDEKENFNTFLRTYLLELQKDNSNIDKAYVTFYEATSFCELIKKEMTEKSYGISYGTVSYKDITQEDKFKLMANNEWYKIAFIKPKKYEYQREFRFFFTPNLTINESFKEYIKECVKDVDKTILGVFNYSVS